MEPTSWSVQDVKARECDERQVEMDAIALYERNREFPAVAGSFVREPPEADGDASGPTSTD